MAKVKEVKTEVKEETTPETMKYVLTMPDGTVLEGSTTLRQFAPNSAKGFQNSGFQVKLSSGNYGGNIMIIDYLRKVLI